MKWIEKKVIKTVTGLTITRETVELFLELSDNSIWGYYYHNYSDVNQNKWFIKGRVVKREKEFFIELTEPEWFSCQEYEYIRITNKFVIKSLKNKKVEINNYLRKVLY